MAIEDTRPPAEFLYESLLIQAYGHSKFSDDIDMPEQKENMDNTQEIEQTGDYKDRIKEHPIARSVYFSGVSEVNDLPHQSPEAIKQYLEFQLKLRQALQHKFNPKPNIP